MVHCVDCGEEVGIGHIVVSSLRKGSLLLCTACKYKELKKIYETGAFFDIDVCKKEFGRLEINN